MANSWILDSLKQFQKRANKLLHHTSKLQGLLQRASKKATKNQNVLLKVFDDLKTLLRLLGAYATGKYRRIGVDSLVIAVSAVIYFVNPFDLIPDFLLGGLVDDSMVLGSVFSVLRSEIEAFRTWEMNQL